MPHYARLVPFASARKDAPPPGAGLPRPRQAWPQRGAAWHAIQLKAAQTAAAARGSPTRSGLPAALKAGVEALSGLAMDDVRVHRNSPEPARLGALAYARGSDIHLGPGRERHLPHEAWHVVQQKQGRVAATTQLEEIQNNDDTRREVETGSAPYAMVGTSPNASLPKAHMIGPAGPVIQAKLQWQGAPLKEDKNYSQASLKFIRLPDPFMLRDDISPQSSDIHVLNMKRKYLLGEFHRLGVWETETKQWNVAKMTEAFKDIPHDPDDKASLFDVPWDPVRMPAGRPLESVHPFFFGILMGARENFEFLLSSMQLNEDRPDKWMTHVIDARRNLADVRTIYIDYYESFWQTYERKFLPTLKYAKTKTSRQPPSGLEKIYAISIKLRNAYWQGWTRGSELFDLTDVLTKIEEFMSSPKGAPAGWVANLKARIGSRMNFLTGLATDLIPIMTDDPKETGTLEKVITESDSVNRPDILVATKPARERSMAAHVGSVAPPLLVQLGDDHVDNVAKLVGSDVAVPIHLGKTLSDITRQS
jgi:hypothetical protein